MSLQPVLSDREALERFRENHPELRSIHAIAELPETTFVEQFAEDFVDGERQARRVHKTAVSIRDRAILIWMNIRDMLSPHYRQTMFNTLPTELPECFTTQQGLTPDYERLFGEELDFIECDHVRSILGPAAYFVDLMRFIDRHITNQPDSSPSCRLLARRPDLPRIRLDDENTNQLIPYIDLVIEILEVFILSSDDNSSDADDLDPYELLLETFYPFDLPFHDSLTTIRRYLQQLRTSLYQIYQVFDTPFERDSLERVTLNGGGDRQSFITQDFLNLSPQELRLVITELASPAAVAQQYGDVPLLGRAGLENVAVFLAQTGLSRDQLNELLFQDLDRHEVNAGLSHLFFINNVEDGLGYLAIAPFDPDETDSPEKLCNLSRAKLDRIYRFVKLAQRLEWPYTDLDRALRALAQPYEPERMLWFDGINDHVAVDAMTQLDREAFTLEAWIHPEQAGKNVILSKGDGATNQLQFMVWMDSSNHLSVYGRVSNGEPMEVQSLCTVPTGVFTHVAVTVETVGNATTIAMYLNGNLDQVQRFDGRIAPVGSDFILGRGLIGATSYAPVPDIPNSISTEALRKFYDESFAGVIKDVRIWDGVRDRETIAGDRYRRFTGNERGLLAYWPLTETPETRLLDLTPNQRHGVMGGMESITQPTWVLRDLILEPLPEQGTGQGFAFNGIDQYLAARPVAYDVASVFTLEAMVRLEEDANNPNQRWFVLFLGEEPSSQARIALWMTPSRQVAVQVGNDIYESQTTLALDTLTHVAVTLEGTALRFYIDGIEDGNAVNSASSVPDGGNDLTIGRSPSFEYFRGAIAEVRLWNQRRSPRQLEYNRHRALAPDASGLIGYWRLDAVAEGMALDLSSSAQDLYLGGVPEDYRPDRVEIDRILPDRPLSDRGITGTVLEFREENDVITLTNPDNDGFGVFEQLTLELWFKAAEPENRRDRHQILITQGDAEAGLTAYLFEQRLYVMAWCADYDDLANPDRIYRTVLVANGVDIEGDRWYHLAIVNDESQSLDSIVFRAYLDSDPDQVALTLDASTLTTTLAGDPIPDDAKGFRLSPVGNAYLGGLAEEGFARVHTHLLIPADTRDQYVFSGQMADLRIWNRARTRDEILTDYDTAPAWNAPDLEAYLPMDEGEGATAIGDRTGNGYRGTVQATDIVFATETINPELEHLYSHYQPEGVAVLGWTNYAYTGKFHAVEVGGAVGVTFFSRHPEAIDQYYRLSLDWGDQPQFRLTAHPEGVQSFTEVVTDAATLPVPAPSRWYRFRIEVEDDAGANQTRIRVKLWPDGLSEPDTYQITAVDGSDIRITAGTVGLWAQATAGAKWFDDVQVVPLGGGERLLATAFEDYGPNEHPEGWVDTGDRLSPQDNAAFFDAIPLQRSTRIPQDAPMVLGTTATEDNIHAHYLPDGQTDTVLAWRNYTLIGRIRISDAASGIGLTVLSRYPDGINQYYSLRRDADHPTFQLVAEPAGVQPLEAAPNSTLDSGIEPQPNVWYHVRIEVEDHATENRTDIRAKIWRADDEPEPSEFQMQGIDRSSVRLTSGTVGLWASGAGAKFFDQMTVLQSVLYDEDFNRYPVGGNPEGWLDTKPRNSREEDPNLFTINELEGALAFSTDSTEVNIHSHLDGLEPLSWTNYAYSGRLRIDHAPNQRPGIGVTFFSQFTDDAAEDHNRYYRLRMTRGQDTLHISPHRRGRSQRDVEGKDDTGFTLKNGVWYRFWIEVEDADRGVSGQQADPGQRTGRTLIRAKVWEESKGEPSAFQIDAYDEETEGNERFTQGTIGVWSGHAGVKFFDDFRVQQAVFLTGNLRLEDWQQTGARDRFLQDDTLFQTAAIPNVPNWVTITDYPLLSSPLSLTALEFDLDWAGEREYLAAATLTGFTSANLTVEAWVKPTAGRDNPVFTWTSGNGRHWFGVNAQGTLTLQSAGTILATGSTSIPADPLTHIALALDGDTATLFVNGEPDGSVTDGAIAPLLATANDNGTGYALGETNVGRDGDRQYFLGQIADLRLWSGARSAEQMAIQQRYQQPDLADPNLVGYWAFDRFTDGGEYALNAVAAPGLENALRLGGLEPERRPRLISLDPVDESFWRSHRRALTFTDTTPPLTLDIESDPVILARRTVEVWFWVADPSLTSRKQVLYQEGDTDRGIVLYIFDGCLYYFGYTLDLGWTGSVIVTDRIDAGRWNHAALVLDGRQDRREQVLRGYLNGKFIDAQPGHHLSDHRVRFSLGGSSGPLRFHDGVFRGQTGHPFEGQILDLRVWNTIRTADQLQEHLYSQPGTPVGDALAATPNLLLWWIFGNLGDPIPALNAGGTSLDLSASLLQVIQLLPPYTLPVTTLDRATLDGLADIKHLLNRHRLSMERLVALWHRLNHMGRDDNRVLYDQIFNPSGGRTVPFPVYFDQPLRWDVTGNEDPERDRQLRARLRGALRLGDADLTRLVASLNGANEPIVEITNAFLTHLFRRAFLASVLRLSIADLEVVMRLEAVTALDELSSIVQLSDRTEWMRLTGITVQDLVVLNHDPNDVVNRPDDLYRDTDVLAIAEQVSENAETVLLQPDAFEADLISEAESADIFTYLQRQQEIRYLTEGTEAAFGSLVDDRGAVTALYRDDVNLSGLLRFLAIEHRWIDAFSVVRAELNDIQNGLGDEVLQRLQTEGFLDPNPDRQGNPVGIVLDRSDGVGVPLLLERLFNNDPPGGQNRERQIEAALVNLSAVLEERQAIQDELVHPAGPIHTTLQQTQTDQRNTVLSALATLFDTQPDVAGVVFDYFQTRNGIETATFFRELESLLVIGDESDTDSGDRGTSNGNGSSNGMTAAGASTTNATDDLNDLNDLNDDDDEIDEGIDRYLIRFGKVIYLSRTFDLRIPELEALLSDPGRFTIQDVLNPTLADLNRLYQFKQLQAAFEDVEGTDRDGLVLNLLALPPAESSLSSTSLVPLDTDPILPIVAGITEWPIRQLIALLEHFDLLEHDGNPRSYHHIDGLSRLRACFDLAQSMNADISFLIQLATVPLASSATDQEEFNQYRSLAEALLDVLRAQYTDEEWERIYPPIRDELAIKRRDALLALAMRRVNDQLDSLSNPYQGRRDADLLYEFFLLDVQVSSEVQTSRLVQANASLQLYVQRCLMDLEAGVDPTEIPADEWEWMKNYRVWEANRKVFLYPENFIEPELRDTKTPLFAELEQELMQSTISPASVTSVYMNYLNKFREITNLKIVGTYLHTDLISETYIDDEGQEQQRRVPDPDADQVLYLIGRTNSQPPIHYVRTKVIEARTGLERWTPWQHIALTINAEHVSPVFAFNRLFLFWPEFAETTQSEELRVSPRTAALYINYSIWRIQRNIERDNNVVLPQTIQRLNDATNRLRQALEAELTDEQIRSIIDDDRWFIQANGAVFNRTTDSVVSVNVDIYQPSIKYAYQDFNQTWLQPQTYLELGDRLRDLEHLRPEWQRVYAQRSMEFANASLASSSEEEARVLAISPSTNVFEDIQRFNMRQLTWTFWVNAGNARNAPEPEDVNGFTTQTTLFDYDNGRFRAIAINTLNPIPERAELARSQDAARAAANAALELANVIANTPGADAAAVDAAATVADAAATAAENAARAIGTQPSSQQERIENISQATLDAAAATRNAIAAANRVGNTPSEAIDDTREAAALANVHASNAEREYQNLDKYQPTRLELQIRIGDRSSFLSLLPAQWNHVALTMEYKDGRGGYDVRAYGSSGSLRNFDVSDAPLEISLPIPAFPIPFRIPERRRSFNSPATFILAALLPDGKRLRVGSTDNDGALGNITLSDLCVWDRRLSAVNPPNPPNPDNPTLSELADAASRRKSTWECRVNLPLNRARPGTVMTIVPSAPSLFFNPPTGISPLEVSTDRERVLVFYGNAIHTLQTSLLSENQLSYTLQPDTSDDASGNYDLDLSPSRLHVALTAGLSINDYSADGVSTLNRFDPSSLQFWNDFFVQISTAPPSSVVFISNTIRIFRQQMQAYLERSREGFHERNAVLTGVSSMESTLIDVGNKPGWYVLDVGQEQFLIRLVPGEDPRNPGETLPDTQTVEQRLRIRREPRLNELSRQPVAIEFTEDETLLVRDVTDPNSIIAVGNLFNTTPSPPFKFKFERLSTTAVNQLTETLFKEGVDGLLSLESQQTEEIDFSTYDRSATDSSATDPNDTLISSRPSNQIDFQGAYGIYYEEIFFHIPFFIANQLNANQNFSEARNWYHYLFNPTLPETGTSRLDGTPANARYWRYLPFQEASNKPFGELLEGLLTDNPLAEASLQAHRSDPFDPHALAALRVSAYQKAIAMKYIDNLLDWGDSLFSQDTRETVNEAMLLYVLAFNLLGPRPQGRTVKDFREIGTYEQFQAAHNANAEFLTTVEQNLEIEQRQQAANGTDSLTLGRYGNLITSFCIPENSRFIGFWDTVEDRLFKIRHSLNIQGVFRQLALFDPPIDPAALVRAVAGGGGISGALADLNVAVPHYRYAFMLDQAKELIGTASDLGSALLEAIENRDAIQLELLENQHERQILDLTTRVKELEISEAEIALESLHKSREKAEFEENWYRTLIADGWLPREEAWLALKITSFVLKHVGVALTGVAAGLRAVPETTAGGAGIASPLATVTTGGEAFAEVAEFAAAISEDLSDISDFTADMLDKTAEFERREEEWRLSENLARLEKEEIDLQIRGAERALDRARRELEIHQREIAQNQEIRDFYRRKFTSEELYNWMIGRLSGLYFQTYQLAYDTAKSAEKALQFELPSTSTFITPSHWDNLRRGLLAGESLMLELQRMEAFHLSQDSRFQEIEKVISLRETFPVALAVLRATGSCEFQLGERLFDRDFPGHYFRVIKSVELEIQTGRQLAPHQGVNATLIQLNNKTLLSPDSSAVQYLLGDPSVEPPDSSTLRVNWRANQQAAISKVNERDDGMFVLNFFLDDRYFPFEGTGAISSWRLDIPIENNTNGDVLLVENGNGDRRLDIEDVLIYLRYTSAFDQGSFKVAVEGLLR